MSFLRRLIRGASRRCARSLSNMQAASPAPRSYGSIVMTSAAARGDGRGRSFGMAQASIDDKGPQRRRGGSEAPAVKSGRGRPAQRSCASGANRLPRSAAGGFWVRTPLGSARGRSAEAQDRETALRDLMAGFAGSRPMASRRVPWSKSSPARISRGVGVVLSIWTPSGLTRWIRRSTPSARSVLRRSLRWPAVRRLARRVCAFGTNAPCAIQGRRPGRVSVRAVAIRSGE